MPVVEQTFLRPGVYRVFGLPRSYTREDLADYARGTNRLLKAGVRVPVLARHTAPGADDRAHEDARNCVGWLQDVKQLPDGSLSHRLRLTDIEAARKIKDGSICFTSPEFREDYTSGNGVSVGRCIRHVALTATPRSPDQGPMMAHFAEPLPGSGGWVQEQGPRGGRRWRNAETGEVRYQAERPGTREAKAEDQGDLVEIQPGDGGPQPVDTSTGKPAPITQSNGQIAIDHSAYPEWLQGLSTQAVDYIRRDAQEAIKANPDNPKAGYYADEINYAGMELNRRKKAGGAPPEGGAAEGPQPLPYSADDIGAFRANQKGASDQEMRGRVREAIKMAEEMRDAAGVPVGHTAIIGNIANLKGSLREGPNGSAAPIETMSRAQLGHAILTLQQAAHQVESYAHKMATEESPAAVKDRIRREELERARRPETRTPAPQFAEFDGLPVQFSMNDYEGEIMPTTSKKTAKRGNASKDRAQFADDEDEDELEAPPVETPPADELETAQTTAEPSDEQLGAQVKADLEAAGIAAPNGDPVADPMAFLTELCAALRQKAMDDAEAEATEDLGDGLGEIDEAAVEQFAEHSDPAVRALAERLGTAERQLKRQSAQFAEERRADGRKALRRKIQSANLPKRMADRLHAMAASVQFGENGAEDPRLTISAVVDLFRASIPPHLQFDESDASATGTNGAPKERTDHPDGAQFFDDDGSDPGKKGMHIPLSRAEELYAERHQQKRWAGKAATRFRTHAANNPD